METLRVDILVDELRDFVDGFEAQGEEAGLLVTGSLDLGNNLADVRIVIRWDGRFSVSSELVYPAQQALLRRRIEEAIKTARGA